MNASSLDIPPPMSPNRDLIKSAEEVLGKLADETQARASKIEEPARKVIGKARKSIRLPSFSGKNQCEQCKEVGLHKIYK